MGGKRFAHWGFHSPYEADLIQGFSFFARQGETSSGSSVATSNYCHNSLTKLHDVLLLVELTLDLRTALTAYKLSPPLF